MAGKSKLAAQTALKRRRVTQACDSCQIRKVKCDSRRPICNRCEGYGYKCSWNNARSRAMPHNHLTLSPTQIVQQSTKQIRRICSDDFPEKIQTVVDDHLTRIEEFICDGGFSKVDKDPSNSYSSAPYISQPHSCRYLGEASDIHFLNIAKQAFQSPGHQEVQTRETLQSYDHEKTSGFPQPPGMWIIELPDRDTAERYITAYFGTIHMAYPFIPKLLFIHKYADIKSNVQDRDYVSAAWLALLYSVLAIGAFYSGFTNHSPEENLHEVFFRRSILLTEIHQLEASTVQVASLLVQCFYLLITSNTDRCWITLGIAIRLAQTLGLHTDLNDARQADCCFSAHPSQKNEIRRRTWYSLYVLDRLVSLQVGRPPAILDGSFDVIKPSTADDEDHNWSSNNSIAGREVEISLGSYFAHMIELSTIIGKAVSQFSKPLESSPTSLSKTTSLDNDLLRWKHEIPYFLQFERIHVFDNLNGLRRQRNMLAIKYHHLRALLYRPFLGLISPCKKHLNQSDTDVQPDVRHRLSQICQNEAREIARLFHNVQGAEQLAQEYPLWQLISCVVCAASILIVSKATESKTPGQFTETNVPCDDTEVLLEVLDVLGRNSVGAKYAKDMISTLLSRCLTHSTSMTLDANLTSQSGLLDQVWAGPHLMQDSAQESNDAVPEYNVDLRLPLPASHDATQAYEGYHAWASWPVSTMTWSSQVLDFIDLADVSGLSGW